MSKHVCHAIGCAVEVPPNLLMCKRHWTMVPHHIRVEVLSHYQPGQCDAKVRPTTSWLKFAREAIAAVARDEILKKC